jgi:MFS family permease
LLLGLGLMSVTSLVFGFAEQIVVLDVTRFIQGIGGACSWAAGMSWLVAAAPDDRRGELIGGALSAAIGGVLLGPVLGGAAVAAGPEPVFGAVALAGVVLAAWAGSMEDAPPAGQSSLASLARSLRSPGVIGGFWLVMLPALFAGVIEVLVPLRLDELGASGLAVGAVFLVAAAVEGVVSPLGGRLSDRRGRTAPIRIGLVALALGSILLPLPDAALLVALALVISVVALGTFWAPAMALLSEAADAASLDQGLAFALTNLAWAGGHVAGGAAGGGLADVTSDAVPYALVAVLCALTLAALGVWSRRRELAARSARA